ncbi:glycine betaine ABC transporter substrate-binding protein [Streptomyces sp. ODS28]|uniref:glycine betaine ABC transporter substrate-binding protein n=1 Tax=Streptomyces sp. ODS28 TaxID=3136688 RepID=UPI0031EE77DF
MPLIRKNRFLLCALALLLLSACSGGSTQRDRSVVLTVPTWAGGEANAAVAKYLLEEKLGYRVTLKKMDESDAWKAVGTGKADAILEDWGRQAEREKWVYQKKTVAPAGSLGIKGQLGWYVPSYMADEHHDITDWKKLNRYAPLFAKGSGKAELLEGSKEFLTHDEELLKNLGLRFDTRYTGSESAQLKEIRKRAARHEPFLTYWWRPHWLGAEVELTRVDLPGYYDGCEDAQKVTCGYPDSELQKYLNADFSKKGGDASKFLKNFQWSEEDQNKVAKRIADDGLSPESAAEEWVKENPGVWKVWLWGLDQGE